MQSKARFLGHPIHPMLIVFPLGLLGASVLFDLLHLATGATEFALVAYWTLAAGLVGGALAAPFGTIDWLAIPAGTRAKRVGALHGIGNVVMLGLFALGWWVRAGAPQSPPAGSVALSLAGLAVSLGTAWLGGELAYRMGVGVAKDAGPDAPSSLAAQSTDAPSTLVRESRSYPDSRAYVESTSADVRRRAAIGPHPQVRFPNRGRDLSPRER